MRIFLSTLLFILLFTPSPSTFAQCSASFESGFESGTYSPPWTSVSASHSYTMLNSNVAQGSYALQVNGGSTTHQQGLQANFPVITPTSASWYVNPSGTGSTNYVVIGGAGMSLTNCIAFFFWKGDLGVLRFVHLSGELDVPVAQNVWHHIELRNINYSTRTFEVWINGNLISASTSFRSTTQNSINQIHLYNYNSGTAKYDHFVFGNQPISLNSNLQHNVCFGGNSGQINVQVSGGTAPYTYAWNTGANTQNISGLSAGNYSLTVTDAMGCTQVLNTQIQEPAPIVQVLPIQACDSYSYNGQTYSTGGNYDHHFVSSQGCDSLVQLQLSIQQSNSFTDIIKACNSYTWIDGNTYTSSNQSAVYTLTNSAGCDSVITLDLTIVALDSSITQSGIVLSAVQSGAAYQWNHCDSTLIPISGATQASFTPTSNGNYSLEISFDGCTAQSDCIEIFSVDNPEFISSNFRLYPNPTESFLYIEGGNADFSVEIFAADGKKMGITTTNSAIQQGIDLRNYPRGLYLVRIYAGGEISETHKIILK